jgi:hypothetical protein
MRREDCVDMFKRIPEEMHPQVNLVLCNQFCLSVDSVARFEPTYVVFRGREGGTTDEGRAFFVPYDEISYIRVERELRMGDIKRMYGETGYLDFEDRLAAASAEPAPEAAKPTVNNPTPAPASTPSPMGMTDPGSIAKKNLLDRIRATRANVAGASTTGKPGNGSK